MSDTGGRLPSSTADAVPLPPAGEGLVRRILLTPLMVSALSLEARMVIPMKKGILTLIFTLIFFMAALGFGKHLQTEASAAAQPPQISQRLTIGILDSTSYTDMDTNSSAVAAIGISSNLGIGSVRQSAC